jgi:predicted Zn finger-like uncharacterized protein
MQIVCPECATAYDVETATLGASGRSVRCVRCRTVWFARPSDLAGNGSSANDDALEAELAAAEGALAGELDRVSADETVAVATDPSQPAAAMVSATEAAAGGDLGQRDVDALWSAVEDEPVEQVDAPSLVPALKPSPMADAEKHPELENIETVAARRAQRRAKPSRWSRLPGWKGEWRQPGTPALIVALLMVIAGLIVWRTPIVRVAPQTASLFRAIGLAVNLRGLAFENVRTSGEFHDGAPVLIIEGTIANVTNKTVEVPRLRFAIRNRAGLEIYAWTSVTGRSILAPGETAAFRTRLASPPSEGRDVVVRFFNRRDLVAGMR